MDHLTDHRVSQRRSCRLVGLSRSVAWYWLKGCDDADLRDRLKVLAERYPRYGYLTLHEMLKREGRVINRKRSYRIYREEGLQVRTKRCKKITRPKVPMPVPTRANERWSADFMSDQLANGRRFRIFNLINDFSRQCVGQIVDTSISGARLTRYLDELGTRRSLPKTLVLDYGPEFTCKAMFFWAQRTGVRLHFIQPDYTLFLLPSCTTNGVHLSLVFKQQPYGPFPDLRGITLRFVHAPILSRFGASGKPGLIQPLSHTR